MEGPLAQLVGSSNWVGAPLLTGLEQKGGNLLLISSTTSLSSLHCETPQS